MRREVWSRDEGKCQWPVDSGGICGSTLRLEIDHVVPLGGGGPSTIDNCRLTCRMHNQLAARQVYGDDWMDRFTSGAGGNVPVAREAEAPTAQTTGFRRTSESYASIFTMQSVGHTAMQAGSPPLLAHSSHLAASIT